MNVDIVTEKKIELPDDLLSQHMSADEMEKCNNGETSIFSITVTGKKTEACEFGCSCS